MSKGVKRVLGIVAAVAIPFIALPIAGLIGLSAVVGEVAAATLVGGALGAGAAAATGNNPLLGAAGGAFGGFMAGGGFGMVKDAFGNITNAVGIGGEGVAGAGAAPISGVEGVAGVTTPVAGSVFTPGSVDPLTKIAYSPMAEAASTGIASAGSSPTSNPFASAQTGQVPVPPFRPTEFGANPITVWGGADGTSAVAASAAPAASSSGFSLSSLGDKLLSNPGSLAQLGMTMFNKAPQELTAAEKAAVDDTARLAGENKALFEQRVSQAEALMNRKNNPEQAYAQTGMLVQRRLEEAQRGKPEANAAAAERRAQIEGSRMGTLAASEAEKQSLTNEQAGLAALPTTAPTGAAGLSLPIYAALDKRREAYNRDLANSVGGLFGSLYGKTAKA
jgi:hypothetical protein